MRKRHSQYQGKGKIGMYTMSGRHVDQIIPDFSCENWSKNAMIQAVMASRLSLTPEELNQEFSTLH
jgi:hypothetical protein